MATKNDVTGDEIKSKVPNDAYRNSEYWKRKEFVEDLDKDRKKIREVLDKDKEQFQHYTEERPPQDQSRIDIIGHNDNDGDHYEEDL